MRINLIEGLDLTKFLNVEKYEPPLMGNNGETRGNFYPFIPKTDEIRLQSVPKVLDDMALQPYVITLKCDGTSSTFLWNKLDDSFHAYSRNLSVREGDNRYWNLAIKHDLPNVLKQYPEYAIQGEICGPGIQRNLLGLRELTLLVFNIYNLELGQYLSYEQAKEISENTFGLTFVPEIEKGDCFYHTQNTLLELAKGKYKNTTNHREGIVIRSLLEQYSQVLNGRLSFKVINNDYLLAEK